MEFTIFHLIAVVSVALLAILIMLVLFEPGLPYQVSAPDAALDSHEYLGYLCAIIDAPIYNHGSVAVLSTGEAIYKAELAAIRDAQSSIHIEAFVFLRGHAADRLLAALIERARAGVRVRLVVDAIGSMLTPDRYFSPLRAVGGSVHWYQPIRWQTLKRFNHRTHRELLIVDGKIGFVGGAGIGDWWISPDRPGQPWRDTTLRLTGHVVGGLQASFAENWLETSGEILSEEGHFPYCRARLGLLPMGTAAGLVISSTPSAGRSTRARMLFQILLASARTSIQISSPYFLPDSSLRGELARAVGRGVEVTLILPGKFNNHPIARRASWRRYGALLKSGVLIYEYQPSMMHAKVLIVDGTWSVLGSTNFDNRSFGLNDEINVAMLNKELASCLQEVFATDLAHSWPISYAEWRRRSIAERCLAFLGIALERQQ